MVDIDKFDTIIFDLGGVILDINPELTLKAFSKLYGKENIKEIYSKELLPKFENGLLTLDELLSRIEEIVRKPVDKDEFKEAWTSMLIGYKPKRIEWIKKLKSTHKLFMLSNTNEVHYAAFSGKLKREYNITFFDLFKNVFLSHEMQLMKPDLEIFKRVLEEESLDSDKTLFIEDTLENAQAMRQLGVETLVIPRNSNFYNYFK